MTEQQQPTPQPQPISPAAWTCMHTIDGSQMVVVRVDDAAGTMVRFMDADLALVVADNMRKEAKEAKRHRPGGLELPPGLAAPNGHPV